ncbi:osteopontin [Paramormyrops kingsleyae]|uniref:osteopontin n=1 Tax=Paramormyrops kingsleyae TaxID=1676925 RepID=UPI000CD60743|nr:dentin sialophosphoprotein-like [Paramormyrops kingsleyae]
MKTAVIFVVLLATVICHPVKRSVSSSESSEEQVKPARGQAKAALTLMKAAADLSQTAPEQAVTAGSDESSDSSDENKESDTASDDSDDDDDTNESDSDETTEVTSVAPTPPVWTMPPFSDNGRGDSLGYPSDYKSIMFMESNKVEKGPSSYKSYGADKMDDNSNLVNKKSSVYTEKDRNDIEKTLKVYKAVQVYEDPTEEDTSTPEMESQGLDPSSERQGPSTSQGTESTDETNTSSDSTSAADGSESSQSSEEATATPGAADADSSESSESQESDSTEDHSAAPEVITAK